MATWGAYFSSYVKKNPGGTPTDKENEPIITPIVPLNTNTDVKTIEPLILEDNPTPKPTEDVKKRFDEKLGSVGNLGMGKASVTRMPTLRSNSRGARMAKMFGYGTPKEEQVQEKVVEDQEEMVTPVEEAKEMKAQVAPEMSKIDQLMTERKAAAIESRSTSPLNTQATQPPNSTQLNQPEEKYRAVSPTQPLQSTEPSQSMQPAEQIQDAPSAQPSQPPKPPKTSQSSQPGQWTESAERVQDISPIQPPEPAEPLQLVQSVEIPEPPKIVQSFTTEPRVEKSKPTSPGTPYSARSSFRSVKSSTKRASNRSSTKASISALDELMAGFGEEFAAVTSATPKPVKNERGVEREASVKSRNRRKPKASISALDDIMAGLYSMEPATKLQTVEKPIVVQKIDDMESKKGTTIKVTEL